jgi:hypothetical protein
METVIDFVRHEILRTFSSGTVVKIRYSLCVGFIRIFRYCQELMLLQG